MSGITLHGGQSQIIQDMFVDQSVRYATVCASRGFGKSYLAACAAVLAVQELVALPADVPNKNVCSLIYLFGIWLGAARFGN